MVLNRRKSFEREINQRKQLKKRHDKIPTKILITIESKISRLQLPAFLFPRSYHA